MKTIEITEMKKYLDGVKGTDINLMFIGDTGIGKTQSIEQYCEENKIFLKTLNLARIEATEALGIPIRSKKMFNGKEYDVITTAMPEWVFEIKEKLNNGVDCMLFLDEFLCSEPQVMNAFLTFITSKKVGDIDLSGLRLVSATNIGKYTFEPDNNILSRFCMFYVKNSSYAKYIEKKAKINILNDYQDENDMEGDIFEERSLKPRCHESLCMLKDIGIALDCYEGFTNRKYEMYSTIEKVNGIIMGANMVPGTEETKIRVMAASIVKAYPRVKEFQIGDKIHRSILDLELANKVYDMIQKIK